MTEFFAFFARYGALLLSATATHLWLVVVSVSVGSAVAIPVGILLSRHRKIAPPVLAIAGVVQTIPGLVLLGFAMLAFGIGRLSAVATLALYAMLPVLRNTYVGITEVPAVYVDAARGIGMTSAQILLKVELPLSVASIVGGTRLSAIYIVSWATIAGLIGAGGLGDLIWTGLATYDRSLIFAGAIPSALLAIALGALINRLQRILTPRGLRKGGAR